MKFSQWFVIASLLVNSACSSLKTREEAKEDAKLKAAAAEQAPPPVAPISEDESETYPATGETPPAPIDDQVLDDELAAIGIDPNNLSGENEGTPEPEDNPPQKPAAKKKKKKKN